VARLDAHRRVCVCTQTPRGDRGPALAALHYHSVGTHRRPLRMTYRDLLTRVRTSLMVLAAPSEEWEEETGIDYDGAQTTTVRYAVKKNRDRLQDEIEHYQELLREKAEELDLERDVLQTIAQKRLQGQLDTEEAGEEPTEAVDEVLATEPAFEPYQVTEAALMEEPGVPIPILDLVDWMSPLGTSALLYTDARITLSVTPDADLSSASAIRAYLVDAEGNRVQWGSDQGGVSAGSQVTASATPEDLTLGGEAVDAGAVHAPVGLRGLGWGREHDHGTRRPTDSPKRMTDVDARQVSGTVGASQPGGTVGASQPSGTVGARLAKPEADLWTPAQLGSDIALWLDWKDSPFDPRTDGGTDYVARWGDLSGNGNDATQSAGSKQPVLDDVILPDSDFLTTNVSHTSSDVISLLALIKYDGDSERNDIFAGRKDGNLAAEWQATIEGGSPAWRFFGDNNSGAVPPVDIGWHLIYWQWDVPKKTWKIRVDGEKYEGMTPETLGNNRPKTDLFASSRGGTGVRNSSDLPFAVANIDRNAGADILKQEGWGAHKADRNGIPEPLDALTENGHPYDRENGPPTV